HRTRRVGIYRITTEERSSIGISVGPASVNLLHWREVVYLIRRGTLRRSKHVRSRSRIGSGRCKDYRRRGSIGRSEHIFCRRSIRIGSGR
ncbi:hypothetical protein PFISCL1PPCAC_23268, partial [Pristionchus fissidentatus]